MTLVPTKKIEDYEGNLGINVDTAQVERLGASKRHNPLTFTDYQAISGDTAIYPGKGTLFGLMYTGLGLGETGEVQGKIKKLYRDGDSPDKREAIKAELGDVLWYLAQTATELGFDLGEIALGNIDKLKSRKERGVLGGNGDNR